MGHDTETAFALAFCPRRAVRDNDYMKFLDGLMDEVIDRGTVMVSTIDTNNNYTSGQVGEVLGFGGSNIRDHLIPFMVITRQAVKIIFGPIEKGGAAGIGQGEDFAARRSELITKENPANFIGVSLFQYLPSTMSVAVRFGNNKEDLKRSAKLCPICRVLKSKIRKTE